MALYANGHKVCPIIRKTAELKDISPITKNGTYNSGANLTVLNSMTFTGEAYVATDIPVPDACNWDIEAKFKVTQLMSGYDKSALFGALGSSYQVLLNQTASGFYLYMHGEYTSGTIYADVGVEYTFIKSGNAATINGRSIAKNNDNAVKGAPSLDLFAYNEGNGTHSQKFIGEFNYLKFIENGTTTHWFVPVKDENNVLHILDKSTCIIYDITGTGVTAGTATSETLYGGFASPLVVNIPSKTKWGATVDDFYNTSLPATPTLHDVIIPAREANTSLQNAFRYSTIKSFTATGPFTNNTYAPYYYTLADNPYLESVTINKGITWSYAPANSWSYLCQNCTSLKHASIDGLNSSGTGSFAYMFYGCSALEDAIISFNPAANLSVTNPFNNTFRNCFALNKATFQDLKIINGGTLTFNYAFGNCRASFDNNINHFRFPVLRQVGLNSGTSCYSIFKYAFTSDLATYCGKCDVIFPELTAIYNRSTTATNGHFSYCDALDKIYLPKFTEDGTTGKNIFNNCSYLTEIHFGIENQATVEALAGYSSKFGATNATLYFDMVNHITVDGVVYDRDGEHYDYDNSYYSWINDTDVVYTTNAIAPAVGDTVYDSTYTAAGTISAVS